MAKTERKTERAIIETKVLVADDGQAYGVSFDVIGCPPFRLALQDLDPKIVFMAACHGLKQKIGDAAAIARGEGGRSATPAMKYSAMVEVFGRLLGTDGEPGSWNARGEGGGGGQRGLLACALDELKPVLAGEGIDKFLASRTAAEQAVMRKDGRIAPIIERIRLEREAKKVPRKTNVDVDALLDELDDLGEE